MRYTPAPIPIDSRSIPAYLEQEMRRLTAVLHDRYSRVKPYTPVWSAPTPPAIGNGTLSGWYTLFGRRCVGGVLLTVGNTTTFGTGAWTFSLPFRSAGDAGDVQLSTALAFDNGTAYRTGLTLIDDEATTMTVVIDSAAVPVATGVPFSWAANDMLRMQFDYIVGEHEGG